MMFRPATTRNLLGLLITCIALVAISTPIQATARARSNGTNCPSQKLIVNPANSTQLDYNGFYTELIGNQATLSFDNAWLHRFLSLTVTSNPLNTAYVASRITEIEPNLAIDQRVKCWQATSNSNVVVDFNVRFDQALPPTNLTENLILWNAPLPAPGSSESPRPITAIGVTRSNGLYAALVAEDFDNSTFTGFLNLQPLPIWLDASQWHLVRITLSHTTATIEVAQGLQGYTTVLSTQLPHPTGPLGFEFSVDNQIVTNNYLPVIVPDSLDADYLSIRNVPVP